jgi:hypothetical protein
MSRWHLISGIVIPHASTMNFRSLGKVAFKPREYLRHTATDVKVKHEHSCAGPSRVRLHVCTLLKIQGIAQTCRMAPLPGYPVRAGCGSLSASLLHATYASEPKAALLKAVSQLLWSGKDREVWFSLGENHERPIASVYTNCETAVARRMQSNCG